MISNSNSTITAILTRRKMKILDLNVFHFKVFVTRKIQIMTISTSWTNMATMSFPCQPLIPYRAAAHARRPLKSSTRPASEGSRRYVNIYQEQSSLIPSLCRNKRFALNEMFQRNSCLLYVPENQSTCFFLFLFHFLKLYIFPYECLMNFAGTFH